MTAPPQGRRIIAAGGLSGRQLEAEVRQEVARIQEENFDIDLPTGRCRVCSHPESRTKVNTLLSYGLGATEILEFVQDINAKRAKNKKITLDSIRNHKQRHFNIQAPTQASYRRILERRRSQLADEFAEGAENLLTGMAYLDVVAHKGWQHLIKEETEVDYETGLKALLKREEMQRDGQIEQQIAQMRHDVSLLQQAVKDVVPDEMLKEIGQRIEELTGVNIRRSDEDEDDVVEAEVVDDFYDQDDDDEAFNPVAEADEGDSIEG